jgi:hypothetical protein
MTIKPYDLIFEAPYCMDPEFDDLCEFMLLLQPASGWWEDEDYPRDNPGRWAQARAYYQMWILPA